MKKLIYFIAAIMMCAVPVSGAWAATFIYADSYADYTPDGQPPRYFITGVTSKPPPIVSHPEYALGAPDIYAAGWGPETGKLVLGFESGLANISGNDLAVWHFGTLAGNAQVKISTQAENPDAWTLLGTLGEIAYPPNAGSGTGSVAQWFDFGAVTDTVYFVMIDKTEGGQSRRGHFIDAVGANAVPIPGALLLLGSGLAGLFGCKRRCQRRYQRNK